MTTQLCACCGKPNTELILRHNLCPPCLEAGYGAMRAAIVSAIQWHQQAPQKHLPKSYMQRRAEGIFEINRLTKLLEQFPE